MACAFSQYRQLEAVRRATNYAPVDRALRCSCQCRLFRRTPVFCDVRFRCAIGLREFSYSEPQKEKRQRHSPPGGKPPGSLAGELIDQGLLCSGSMAKNVRTDITIVSFESARDLLLVEYCLVEQAESQTVISTHINALSRAISAAILVGAPSSTISNTRDISPLLPWEP